MPPYEIYVQKDRPAGLDGLPPPIYLTCARLSAQSFRTAIFLFSGLLGLIGQRRYEIDVMLRHGELCEARMQDAEQGPASCHGESLGSLAPVGMIGELYAAL